MGSEEVRNYEAMFIVVPTLSEDASEKVIKGLMDMIIKHGGEVEESQKWAKRRLAYRVRRHQEGIYHLIRFKCKPSAISELRSGYRLNEDILRVLIITLNSRAKKDGGT